MTNTQRDDEAFIERLPAHVGHNLRHFGPSQQHHLGGYCWCEPERIRHNNAMGPRTAPVEPPIVIGVLWPDGKETVASPELIGQCVKCDSRTHETSEHPDAQRCSFTVTREGEDSPCERPATGWRWYQGHDHEDTLEPACAVHENTGGNRMHAAEALVAELRSALDEIVFACAPLDWATDGRPETAVAHVREVVRRWGDAGARATAYQEGIANLERESAGWQDAHGQAQARLQALEAVLGRDGHGYLPSGVALDLRAIADQFAADQTGPITEALSGVELTVGFRDDAGDDDWATGTLDQDESRTIARALAPITDRPLLGKWLRLITDTMAAVPATAAAPAASPAERPNATPDHEFLPVAGHPDDDECTFRSDGTDATYCGRPSDEHTSPAEQEGAPEGHAPGCDGSTHDGPCADRAALVAEAKRLCVAYRASLPPYVSTEAAWENFIDQARSSYADGGPWGEAAEFGGTIPQTEADQ
ncbi:hypothetical protein [Phycicoccus sp. 3266]|uniref:hypothetical protein n=1 Tax=Phycicoccus sp. 3266 TaxID=2817751 RepID=UPI00285F1700|nr:hypothetical protein [Phycicoccus sp. 3266]MDR6861954.1 hypothetical protein [Phycicoccus sp. 3266]